MDNNNASTRVLIVDDHQMFLDGIKTLLAREKKVKIVAEALSGEQALDILKTTKVDLLITDINMPGMSGTELTRTIKKDFPEVKVLVLTMYNEREIVHEIAMTEAEGYILKNAGKTELVNAIQRIADNGTYYSNEVISIMTEDFRKEQQVKENTRNLTKREREIIGLICEELTTNEIAEKLFLSALTVETHRKNILKKTKNKTIVGLIKFAIENDLTG